MVHDTADAQARERADADAGRLGRTARVGAPVAVTAFVAIGLALRPEASLPAALGALVTVATTVALARARTTGWALVAGLALAAAGVTAVCSGQPANLGWFALCLLAGWAALVADTPRAAALGAVLVASLVPQWLATPEEAGWGAWMAGTVFTTVACDLSRRQRHLADQLRAAQAGLADRARAEERHRIAAELHDVIGHALTVSLLHVSSARLALEDDLDEARASLDEAERLTRRSLGEVRAGVGLIREPGGSAAPLPGAGDLPALVDSFRRAGTDVTCDVVGDPARLSASSGLTVYRILQESLTNVARHAPGAPAVVRLEVEPVRTRLTVESALAGGVAPAGDGAGVGVPGMRERAEALGGSLSAGPCPAGWRVEAVLPA